MKRTLLVLITLAVSLVLVSPFTYSYETWYDVTNAYITGHTLSSNEGISFMLGTVQNFFAILDSTGFHSYFVGGGLGLRFTDMNNPCDATLTIVTSTKTITVTIPYRIRAGIYSINNGVLVDNYISENPLPICPAGQSCVGGICQACTPDCSCAANTCQGQTCSDGCGGTCGGVKPLINGGWSPWSNWSTCSNPCDGGTQSRVRTCDNPAPQCGGDSCTGPSTDVRACNTNPCCTPDCSCAANTCQGQTCSDGCGGLCQGTKNCSDPCLGMDCNDYCNGNIRYYNGTCLNGLCNYNTEVCTPGCSGGACFYSRKQPKTTKTTYEYDNYGNIIKIYYHGDINKQGDEKSVVTNYLYDSNAWILNKPKNTYILDSDNTTKVKEYWFSYDMQAYNQIPVKGDLTQVESWLDTGENPVTDYWYDSFGNIVNVTDPNKYSTGYFYDETNTFLTKIKNSKNHIINYRYDKGAGNLVSIIDPNGHKTEYLYDVFGREIKEIRPYDSWGYPTANIEYNLDGNAPEEIKIKIREKAGTGNTFDIYYYYDGFGMLLQKKKESESPELITQDTYYNEIGGVKKESNPYYSGNGFTQPNETLKVAAYIYDPLGRITQITKPDDSAIRYVYDHWIFLVYDENNNKKEYEYDSYGRIVKVKEYNEGETYTTAYSYDVNDNLIKILDNQGNLIQYNYDSLNRKTKLNDSDLGIWSYAYDKAGNIIKQTDNKGNSISLQFDKLNRIKNKSTSEGDTIFSYDSNKIGTLSSIYMPNIQKNFWYDNRLRNTKEELIIDGISFNTTFEYDSMNRVVLKTLPNGEIINATYNNQSLIESIQGILKDLSYNEFGQTLARDYQNNLNTLFEYDPDNFRLSKIKTGDMQEHAYSYDEAGNVLEINDFIDSKKSLFSYDDLNRLIHAEKQDYFNVDYDYDSIGNLKKTSTGDDVVEFIYKDRVHAPIMIIMGYSRTNFSISLAEGWNLVSLPLKLDNETLPQPLESIRGSYSFVGFYAGDGWKSYEPSKTENSLKSINATMGFWINMNNNATLTIEGTESNKNIALKEGLNMIGFPQLNSSLISETFNTSQIGYIWLYNNSIWYTYNPNKPTSLNTLKKMTPGYGYFVYYDNTSEYSGGGGTSGPGGGY